MTQAHEAIVYDLDGTLVELDVDWDTVASEAASVLRARDIEVEDDSLWEILDRAEDEGYRPAINDVIAEHERAGARTSTKLAGSEELPQSVPVGVCSLNCEGACRIALEIHGLDRHVDVIVGRDTVSGVKPDPEPLLHAIEALSARPEQALFIGNRETDEETADRAGVDYEYISDRR